MTASTKVKVLKEDYHLNFVRGSHQKLSFQMIDIDLDLRFLRIWQSGNLVNIFWKVDIGNVVAEVEKEDRGEE